MTAEMEAELGVRRTLERYMRFNGAPESTPAPPAQ